MINVKIIQDSYSPISNNRITTFELEYPRFIHSEIMTHRVFSRNAQSSRAVPVKTAIELIRKNMVFPVAYGKNKSGMSSEEYLTPMQQLAAEAHWSTAGNAACDASEALIDIGLHKQWANRITEPFSHIKVVITATTFDNFFWLRDDPDAAQPEIVELARKMKQAYDESEPMFIYEDDWHVPYVDRTFDDFSIIYSVNGKEVTADEARKISASCCAQVSYRKLDDSYEKALQIYERLFDGPKPHLSPVEHQATPIIRGFDQEGVTHINRSGKFYSNNFEGFVQYRAILEQEQA